MKKIPTLFLREFENHKVVRVHPVITEGCEEAYLYGDATVKMDGSCCAIIEGKLYKRYDTKKGRKVPEGAIPCQNEPDPVTGHFPFWVECDRDNPADKWFFKAFDDTTKYCGFLADGTYEAVGKHFNGNPYNFDIDTLYRHGNYIAFVERTYSGVFLWLSTHKEEGLVFWYDGKPVCKIKRTDFGLEWPIRSE